MTDVDRDDVARRIIDANAYMTLATADATGTPWPSPVWFAHDRYQRFVWVSRPDARHSRNLVGRPEVGVVMFDSTVPIGNGQAVYVEATARLAPDAELEGLLAIFSARSTAQGGAPWQPGDVSPESAFRLYVADAAAHFVLDGHDRRVVVRPHGR